MGILRSLFGSSPPLQPFKDPVLGDLQPDETGWTVSVTAGGDAFSFTIGGGTEPDAALLAHARDILGGYPAFKKRVEEFVRSESVAYPPDIKVEVAQLEIDSISLFWPDRPDDGMIFFRGPENEFRLWRCDYIARKPTGLGCDT